MIQNSRFYAGVFWVFTALFLSVVGSASKASLSASENVTHGKVEQSGLHLPDSLVCRSQKVALSIGFPAARLNGCTPTDEAHFTLFIAPESAPPINPSPWYAFRVDTEAGIELALDLTYGTFKHRYAPKISTDGKHWIRLPDKATSVRENGGARLRFKAPAASFFIAGQEILTTEEQYNWLKNIEDFGASVTLLGVSSEGRPLYKAEHKPASGKRYILLTGRQHPPEVTGALALMPFVETLFADTPLAQNFRTQFGIIVVPVLNPDGVLAGHWRHNMGDTDLNRDWGPFTQPETRLIQQELTRFHGGGDTISLFLDFHSTRRNVLYTQADTEVTSVPHFARHWVKAVQNHGLDYKFERAERPLTDKATAKNYMYRTYGIPSITYEVADEANRQDLREAAVVFAEEMMRIMLSRQFGA